LADRKGNTIPHKGTQKKIVSPARRTSKVLKLLGVYGDEREEEEKVGQNGVNLVRKKCAFHTSGRRVEKKKNRRWNWGRPSRPMTFGPDAEPLRFKKEKRKTPVGPGRGKGLPPIQNPIKSPLQ